MKKLAISFLFLCSAVFGQGTALTPGTMTTLAAPGGYPIAAAGFDKGVWVGSLGCFALWVNYKTVGVTSEAQDALMCYSYAEHRTHLLAMTGAFHSAHGPSTGHQWGTMFWDADADAITWIAQSGSNSPDMHQELYRYDVQGRTVSRMPLPTTASGLRRVWADGNIIYKAAAYDPVNHRGVFFPNYQNSTGSATICNFSAMTCINSGTTNGPVVLDEPALTFSTYDNKVWVYDGTNMRALDASGSGTWTAPTTTCTGADCVSGTRPPGRKYEAIAWSPDDSKFLMVGGITGTGGTAFVDIWSFNPATLAWNEECASSCGYTNDASQPNTSFNRMAYSTSDHAFVYLQYPSTVKGYAFSSPAVAPLNYGRVSNTYGPPAGSINRTAPPAPPSTSTVQTQAFDLSISASGSTYYVARVETGVPSDGTSCAVPVPYVWSSASGGTNLPSGTQASACAATGYNSGSTTPSSHPFTALVNGTQWLVTEKHGYGGASNNSAAFAGTYNGTSWTLTAIPYVTAGATAYPQGLVAAGTTPTAAVIEQDNGTDPRQHKLYVSQWGGSSWSVLGGVKLNIGGAGSRVVAAGIEASAANDVAAVWAEETNTDRTTMATTPQIYAKLWNGSAWTRMQAASLNVTASAFANSPRIIKHNGVWYAAWVEFAQTGLSNVYVKSYNSGADTWSLVGGGSLNINTSTGIAHHPTIASDGTTLYLGWEEQSAWGQKNKGYVKSWNGSAWSTYASATAKDSTNGSVANFSIVYAGGVKAVWTETVLGNLSQVYTADLTPVAPTTANTLTIKNEGSTVSNHPVQIGRAFAQGEIPNGSLPQAWVGSTAVATQVDVKARWSDNSLKHAIISFLIPTFTSGTTYTITFASGTTVGNTALTQAQMLDVAYDFDAVISLTNGGTTRTASARTMLTNGDYTVWASGPIATTVLLGHHGQGYACPAGTASGAGSVSSKYDFGMNARCAFRPLFQATFWATINKVWVRYVGEIANTEQYEDVAVDSMLLTSGSASPSQWYTHASAVTMNAGTRWTKTTWIGGAPPAASFNHNLAYLASTKALPNYDTSKVVAGSYISSRYTTWSAAGKDLYQKGTYDIPLSAGGGHDYVAPYEAWTVCWLYTGDIRCQEETVGNAELYATVPLHYREGNSAKKLDFAQTTPGVGYPATINGRPTVQWLSGIAWSNTAVNDRIVAVGTVTDPGWGFDTGHQPFPYSALYLTTGDHFYLEEMLFIVSHNAGWVGNGFTDARGRGPTGKEAGISDKSNWLQQLRGTVWSFRNRTETAWLMPDAHPMKAVVNLWMDHALAMWEGQRNITNGAYNATAQWNFGALTVNPATWIGYWDYLSTGSPGAGNDGDGGHFSSPPALHFWDIGNYGLCETENNLSVTKSCMSLWWQNPMQYVLGRAAELGYASDKLVEWLSVQIIAPYVTPGYNPWLQTAYRTNTFKATNAYNATWAEVMAGWTTPTQNETGCEPGGHGTCSGYNGNMYPAIGATAMVAHLPNGGTAWNWVNSNVLSTMSNDYKWAILPRSVSAATSSVKVQGTAGIKATIR